MRSLVATAIVGCILGCVAEPSSRVCILDVSAEPYAHEALVDGANAWAKLGYLASAQETGEPECEDIRDGVRDGEPCTITIVVWRQRNLIEQYGASAIASRAHREVRIDARFTSYYDVLTLAAHEVGHVLLDAGHLPEGQRGVMAASGGSWSPTAADWALACESLGVCVDDG